MTTETYQKVIVAGLDGLPDNYLAEIAEFVFFLRHKLENPNTLVVEVDHNSLQLALHAGWQESLSHLEEEFADYDQRFLRLLEEARQRVRTTGGVSLAEMRQQVE